MALVDHLQGQLIKGSTFLKTWFKEGSRPTKRELCQMILDGRVPGWVDTGDENGTPWVDEDTWLRNRRLGPTPKTEPETSGLFLLT